MASFPSITTVTAVAITSYPSLGVTYQSLLNSFTSTKYVVNSFYIQASSISQLTMPISFTRFDANGVQMTNVKTISPSSFQSGSIAAINVPLEDDDIIFDGFLSMNFSLLPNQSVYMVINCDTKKTIDYTQILMNEINKL